MILNKAGETFEYEGKMYTVGEFIYANETSDYAGLFGVIKEIRDGDDKDTENDTPDIYCSFDDPTTPHDIKEIEERFSELYDEPKKLEDIVLDIVIMAPEEISVVHAHETQTNRKVFLLVEDWATDDDSDVNIEVYATHDEALMNLRLKVREEYESGLVAMWSDNSDENEGDDSEGGLIIDSQADSFEAYIGGYYCSSHYNIYIKEEVVHNNFMEAV